MDLIGYLITVANLQQMTSMGGYLTYVSVHMASFDTLTKDLLQLSGFPIEGYRNNGLQRHGDLGVYVPNNLRDYIFKGEGDPDEEGIIIKLHHGDGNEPVDYNKITYFIHGKGLDAHTRNTVMEELIRGSRRNKRSLLHTLLS